MKYIDGRDENDVKNEEKLESQEYYDQLGKKVKWYHRVLLNKPLKIGLVLAIFAILAPILIYFYLFEGVYEKMIILDGKSIGTCGHIDEARVQCGSDNITFEECEINCCFDVDDFFCYHRLPSRFSYIIEKGDEIMKPRFSETPYTNVNNIPLLQLFIDEISTTHVNFVLYDPDKRKDLGIGGKVENKPFNYTIYYPEFNIEVFSTMKNISKPLLSTARGPLIASENIWEWSFHLSDDHLYGMGELILNSKPSEMLYNVRNRTSIIPFAMGHRNGSFHGIYIQTVGPMEFEVSETKLISVRSFSGESLSVHFFYGDRPRDVLDQFTKFIGRPQIPPYWALGVHFCRNETSSKDINVGIDSFEKFTAKAEAENLPYDSDCIGDEFFQYINFDENIMENITTAAESLYNESRHFLPSIRPHMKFNDSNGIYDSASEAGILLLEPIENETLSDEAYRGILNGETVVFPDYSIRETVEWFLNRTWPFAGFANSFILKDNWPENSKNESNCTVDLPYIKDNTYSRLCESIPWNVRVPNTNDTHMKNHNSYGYNFGKVIGKAVSENSAASNESAFIISSTFHPGNSIDGFRAQNIESTWTSMKNAFRKAVANSMAGSYIQSIPVCGDSNSTSEKEFEALCLKWYLASISLPMFHVHSNFIKRHPFAFSGFAKKAMMKAIETRYRLLPYYYTTLGHYEPILRGMYYEFLDEDALSAADQFMIGEAVMIAPEFSNLQTSVNVYFPKNETWFDLWGGDEIIKSETGWMEIPTLETDIAMFLRAGFIVPIQETSFPTAIQRRINSNYTLIIGLNCTSEENACSSSGSIFIENFAEIQLYSSNTTLTISVNSTLPQLYMCGEVSSSIINRIRLYGLNKNDNSNEDSHVEENLGIDFCMFSIYEHKYNLK